jgi:UDP:flavonoid glycosyltransferase YjiC (YdhE family)
MGIVAKSVAAGVPLVCVPFGRDQPEIGRRVAESGAGVLLKHKQLDPERLRDAVRRARGLTASAGRAARVLAEHSGPWALATAVEGLVRNGHPVG